MSASAAARVAEDLKETFERAAGDGTVVEPDYPLAELTTLRAGAGPTFSPSPKARPASRRCWPPPESGGCR